MRVTGTMRRMQRLCTRQRSALALGMTIEDMRRQRRQ